MKEITPMELKNLKEIGSDFLLIDIREPHEVELGNINGKHIPMGEIIHRLNEVPRDKQVVIHCKSGSRSTNVVKYLESEYGYNNLLNLKGGILAWKNEIDPTISVL